MGYSYEILLEHKEGDEWKILEEYCNSGSYGCSDYHYFFNKFEWSNKIENYERKKNYKENGYYYIDIEQMKKDYLEIYNKTNNWKNKLIEYIRDAGSIELVKEFVEELSHEVNVPIYFEELEKWYKIVKGYEEKGNRDMRIVFGYSE